MENSFCVRNETSLCTEVGTGTSVDSWLHDDGFLRVPAGNYIGTAHDGAQKVRNGNAGAGIAVVDSHDLVHIFYLIFLFWSV